MSLLDEGDSTTESLEEGSGSTGNTVVGPSDFVFRDELDNEATGDVQVTPETLQYRLNEDGKSYTVIGSLYPDESPRSLSRGSLPNGDTNTWRYRFQDILRCHTH